VLFQKILIAIDDEPVAAHAADIGVELARLAGAEMAFIHVIDAELVNAADTGIQPDVFVASAKEEARKLIDDFRKRLPQQVTALDFVRSVARLPRSSMRPRTGPRTAATDGVA